jgi:hypothetical protein
MLNRKGQNIAEYSILIAIVVAAAVTMQVYVRRGLQGRVADTVDHAPGITVADQPLQFDTRQYEPYYVDSSADVDSSRDYTEALGERGETGRTEIEETTTRKKGSYETSTWEAFDADSER